MKQTQVENILVNFKGATGNFRLEAEFTAPARGITGIYGPSGCGKTTVLRCIAGLEHLQGKLLIGNQCWQDSDREIFLRTHERPIGYVFQEASLFPHLSVHDNLLYGARRLASGTVVQISQEDTIDMLGLSPLMQRMPGALSGGERQRVAIGRALLSQPRLLLMDEPLSALDHESRRDILPYLETLHEALAIPCLYVSHEIAEIERLADTLVLMNQGKVVACGPLRILEADPGLPLMKSEDAAVTLTGKVNGVDEKYSLNSLDIGGASVLVSGNSLREGDSRRVRIKASDVSFSLQAPQQTSILNCLPVKVISVTADKKDVAHVTVLVALENTSDDTRLIGRITRKSLDALDLTPGTRVFAQIKSVALIR